MYPSQKNKGHLVKLNSMNNNLLINQIWLSILSDHTAKRLSNFEDGKGEIQYYIRDGQLQKRKYIRRSRLINTTEVEYPGMSRNGVNTYKMLITSKLEKWEALDYGTINVLFQLNTTGEFVDGEIIISTEEHYARL